MLAVARSKGAPYDDAIDQFDFYGRWRRMVQNDAFRADVAGQRRVSVSDVPPEIPGCLGRACRCAARAEAEIYPEFGGDCRGDATDVIAFS